MSKNKNAEIIELSEILSLIPKRKKDSSKYNYGKSISVCGSAFYRGAAALCSKASLRCGIGIATLASTEKVISSISALIPECTFLPLTESKNGSISHDNLGILADCSKKYNAMLVGCGLSIDDSTRILVKELVKKAECRLVIDADGLNIISEEPKILKKAKQTPVITPHFGEMARLCGKNIDIIASDPQKYAVEFSKKYGCVTVLKSSVTYIATPDGNVAVNQNYGNPGLARGGSGDVLAGMICSFLGQGLDPFDAAKCGVCLHGEAADRCAKRLSENTMLPSDILDDLSSIF